MLQTATPAQVETTEEWLLREARQQNIGFELRASKPMYHLWLTDHDSRRFTPAERRRLVGLVSEGKLHPVHAVGNFSRGYLEAR